MNNKLKIALIVLGISAAVTTGVIFYKKMNKKTVKAVKAADGNEIILNEIQKRILTEAAQWVGVKEIQKNKSFDNKEFLAKMKAVGWKENTKNPDNAAYCATFVRMVLIECSTGKAKEFFKKNTSAAALTTWNNLSKPNEYTEKITTPEPACLVCYKHHTEFLYQTDGVNHTVITANSFFEDNVTQGVVKKLRKAGVAIEVGNDFLGYIRIKKLD